jgi:hypothetical protein
MSPGDLSAILSSRQSGGNDWWASFYASGVTVYDNVVRGAEANVAKVTKHGRRRMPKHIHSIHQLRDFIRIHDDLRVSPDGVNKIRKAQYSTLVYRLKHSLEVPDLGDLDDKIRRVVSAFEDLQDACKLKKSTSVKLGSTHLLSVRLVPSLIKAYRQAIAESPGASVPRVELVYDMNYRGDDERESYAAPELSLTYRARETTDFEGRELIYEAGHHRCIITRNDNPFAALKDRIERGDFQWKFLRNNTVAILARDANIPDFPYESVAASAQLLLVRAVIEAHEHVRAGNADIAFTHVDPLDRNELRDFTVIRLSHLVEFGKTRLCLLRKSAAHAQEKQSAVNTLSTIATNYLRRVDGRHKESARLSEAFNKFRYAYHTSCVRVGSKGLVERRWLRGTFRFEVFVSHVTSNEQPVWFIKAIHEIQGPGEAERRVFMFGRVRSREGSGLMSWFATYSGSQQGSLRIAFSRDHLDGDRHAFIEGIFTSRPTWLSADETLDVAGALILHQSPNLSDEALSALLTRMRAKAKKQFPGKCNPFNPWELPEL